MTTDSATILVVDDTEGSRYVISRILRKAGHVVHEAATGADAIRLSLEKPDLVILDIGLPDISGYEVCKQIKANPSTSYIPVLHVSASFIESENRVRGLEGGADGYLFYPVEQLELLANVRALLRVREAERMLRQQRELLLVTLSSIGDAVIATNERGDIAFINPVAQALTGWSGVQAVGSPLPDVFHILDGETGRRIEDGTTNIIEFGASGDADRPTILVARDGARRPIESTASIMRNQEGGFVGVVVVFRDVSDRRAAELALQRSEWRHRRLFDSNIIGVLTMQSDGRILEANKAFLDLTGYRIEDFADGSLNWWRITPPETAADVMADFIRSDRESRESTFEQDLIGRDGLPIPVLVGRAPDEDASGEAVCFVLDISERKAAEKALRDEARRKDEFLAMLGHELRNPLAPIRSAGQIVRAAADGDDAVGQAGQVIERQVEYMTRLVDDLLDMSRVSQGKIRLRLAPVDLAEALAHAAEHARPQMDARSHAMTVSPPAEPLYVSGDMTRLVQVFANLLSNAAKFTEPGGRISISAEREGSDAVVRVRDSGIGIRSELLPHVFDLFVQSEQGLDRAEGGLGIGLTLVKSLVDLHGGSVAAHSLGTGTGAEFVVRIPAADESPAPLADPTVWRESGRGDRGRRVLVVDDNRDGAASLAVLLQLDLHEVTVAHDGKEAMEAAAAKQPEIVFLDIGLPGMSGLDVARALRQIPGGDRMVLVAMTGYGQEHDRQQSKEAGFDAHLVKPIDVSALDAFLGKAPVSSV